MIPERQVLEPVCQIVADSRESVADAVATQDAPTIAMICRACADNIQTAAEIAGLPELQDIAVHVSSDLGRLDEEDPDWISDVGTIILDWSGAVLTYLEHPDESAQLENLASPRFRIIRTAPPETPKSAALLTEDASATSATITADANTAPASLSDDVSSLIDIIAAARADILDEADKLSDARTHQRDYPKALDACVDQLDCIASMLDAIGWNALAAICSMVRSHYSSLAEERGFTEEDCYNLILWMEDLAAYLSAPSDDAAAKRVLDILPADLTEGLSDLLLAERSETSSTHLPSASAATNAAFAAPAMPASTRDRFPEDAPVAAFTEHVQSAAAEAFESAFPLNAFTDDSHQSAAGTAGSPIDSPWNDDADAETASSSSAAMPSAAGVLGILQEELAEVSEELSALAAVITAQDADMAAIMDAAAHYSEIVERVITASESLGMSGLCDVGNFVNQNVSLIATSDAEIRCRPAEVLTQWPRLVMSYLSAPTDEQLCLSVIAHLQNSLWPEPLADEGARHLLGALATEIIEPELGGAGAEQRQTVASAEDVALEIAADVNHDLLDAFFHESPTHAATLSDCIARIGRQDDVPNNIAKAQRIAHTLKGSANLIGARGLANLTHHMEDIFEFVNTHHADVPAALSALLQEAADCVEAMIEALQGRDAPPRDALRILQELLDWANRIDAGNLEELPPRARPDSNAPAERAFAAPADESGAPIPAPAAAASGGDVVRVPTRTVTEMFRMVGEMSIAIVQMQEHLKRVSRQAEDLRLQDDTLQKHRFELEDAVDVRNLSNAQRRMKVVGEESNFDSLEMDHYDEVYGSAHAFIESMVDYREMMLHLHDEVSNLEGLFHQQKRLNKELQRVVMSTRLVPVNNISSRLQRTVRQACRATGKQVELEIIGEDLLIDGDVLNNLADPIMHLLRNSVDHGIEATDTRTAAGKPEHGRIALKFAQHGNNLLVHCEDDGKGLDYQRIHATALKRGLVSTDETLDEHAMARLILLPGFSTREQATQISGRGVGMDVVNTTIRALNGSMDIGNREAGGCRVSLRLPITLVTSHSVLVRVGRELFAVPTNSLSQILAPGTGEFHHIGRDFSYQMGDDTYPAMTLASMVGARDASALTIDTSKTVLLVRLDTDLAAVVVDYVIGAFDLVIKGTGSFVRALRGIAGVSILGDGSVVSVLNVPDLIQSSTANGIAATAHDDSSLAPLTAASVARILIVDDSLSVRKSLSQLMADTGYDICIARDGLEAIEVLHKERVDLVLTDLEMPRLTGLELTSHIRSHPQLQHLPVIMITSRSMQKHRDHAQRVGVNQYMNKPFSEDELLIAVETLLADPPGGDHGN